MWDRYIELAANTSIGAVVLDSDYCVKAVGDGVIARSGFARSEFLHRHALDLVHPDDASRAAAVLASASRNGEDRGEGMYRLALKSGDYETFALRSIPTDAANVIVMEIGEASEALRASELSRDLARAVRFLAGEFSLRDAIDGVQSMVERHAPGGRLVVTVFEDGAVSTTFSRGVLPIDILETNRRAHPKALPDHVIAAINGFQSYGWGDSCSYGFHDPTMPERMVFPMLADDETLIGYVEALRTTSKTPCSNECLVYGSASQLIQAAILRSQLDRALRRAAEHDSLTGLLNRRGFFRLIEQRRAHDGAVIVLDLDAFSEVNSQHGHGYGDDVLRIVGKRLKRACSATAHIARLGGDEFIVWLPHVSRQQADEAARSIREELEDPIWPPQGPVLVRASFGVVAVTSGESIEAAIVRADRAMYEAKTAGGNQVACA